MLNPPRKTVAELIARYKLEPSLKDLYVEGAADVRVMRKFSRELKLPIEVYAIDGIDCPVESVTLGNFANNAKGRVQWLADELDKAKTPVNCSVRCIVDRDFDFLIGESYENPLLLYTQFSSMEGYFINTECIGATYRDTIDEKLDCDLFVSEASDCLENLYEIRATSVLLRLDMQWLDLQKYVTVPKPTGLITFRRDEFILSYLNKNGHVGKIDEFKKNLQAVATRNKKLGFFRGHDFFELFAIALKTRGFKVVFCHENVLFGLAIAGVTAEHLNTFELFQKIVIWATQDSPDSQ